MSGSLPRAISALNSNSRQNPVEQCKCLEIVLDQSESDSDFVAATKAVQNLIQNGLATCHLSHCLISQLISKIHVTKSQAKFLSQLLNVITSRSSHLESKLCALHVVGVVIFYARPFCVSVTDLGTALKAASRSSEPQIRAAAVTCMLKYLTCDTPVKPESVLKSILPRMFADKESNVQIRSTKCVPPLADHCKEIADMENLAILCQKQFCAEDPRVRFAFGNACGAVVSRMHEQFPDKFTFNNAMKFLSSAFFRARSSTGYSSCAHCIVEFIRLFTKTQSLTPENITTLVECCLSLPGSELSKSKANRFNSFVTGNKQNHSIELPKCVDYMLGKCFERLDDSEQKLVINSIYQFISRENRNPLQISLSIKHISLLLERLGPESSDFLEITLKTMIKCLSHNYCVIRQKAAVCLVALGRVIPEQLSTFINVLQKVVRCHVIHGDALSIADVHTLVGNAFGLSSLLELVPESALGVPRNITSNSLEVAKKLLEVDPSVCVEDNHPVAGAAVNISGWNILNSLLKFGASWASSKLKMLFSFWKLALGKQLTFSANPKETYAALSVRTAALRCLRTFIISFTQKIAEHEELLTSINRVLTNSLYADNKMKEAMKNKEKSLMTTESRTQIRMMRGIIFDCYTYLPPESFSDKFIALLKLANGEFSHRSTARSRQMDVLLDSDDDFLTESEVDPSYDDFEKKTCQMSPYNCWLHSLDAEFLPLGFEEGSGMGEIECCGAAVRLFCKIFPHQSNQHKKQLVKHFIDITKDCRQMANDSLFNVLHNSAAVILGCCIEMAACNRKFGKGETRETIIQIMTNLLVFEDTKIRRAAAQALGVLSRLEGVAFADMLFKFLSKKMALSEVNLQSGIAFTIGCMHRSIGPVRSLKFLDFNFATLQALSREQDPEISIWLLHTIDKICHVVGPENLQTYHATIIQIIRLHMCHIKNTAPRHLMYSLGKLVWSFGQQGQQKLPVTKMTSLFLNEFGDPTVETWSVFLLEPEEDSFELTPRIIRKLESHMFCQEGPFSKEILRLLSRLPNCELKLIRSLFAWMNNCAEESLIVQIRALLEHFVANIQEQYPETISSILRECIIGGKRHSGSESDANEFHGAVVSSRWSTQIFACQCLMLVLERAVELGGPHTSLVKAREGPQREYVCQKVATLTRLILRIVASTQEQVATMGFRLLQLLIECFARQADPDAGIDGVYLLDQYGAPLLSSFKTKSINPRLKVARINTSLTLLKSPLATNSVCDTTLKEWLDLLKMEDAKSLWELTYGSYISTIVVLSVLDSICKLRLSLKNEPSIFKPEILERLKNIIEPEEKYIEETCIRILKDHMIATSVPRKMIRDFQGEIFHGSDVNQVKQSFSEVTETLVTSLLSFEVSNETLLDLLMVCFRTLQAQEVSSPHLTFLSSALPSLMSEDIVNLLDNEKAEVVNILQQLSQRFSGEQRQHILTALEKCNHFAPKLARESILALVNFAVDHADEELLTMLSPCCKTLQLDQESADQLLTLVEQSFSNNASIVAPPCVQTLAMWDGRDSDWDQSLLSCASNWAGSLKMVGSPGVFNKLSCCLHVAISTTKYPERAEMWPQMLPVILGVLQTSLQNQPHECLSCIEAVSSHEMKDTHIIRATLLPDIIHLLLNDHSNLDSVRVMLIFLLQFFDFAQDFIEPILVPFLQDLLQNRPRQDPLVILVRQLCSTTSQTCQEILEAKKILLTTPKKNKKRKKKAKKKKKKVKAREKLDLSAF